MCIFLIGIFLCTFFFFYQKTFSCIQYLLRAFVISTLWLKIVKPDIVWQSKAQKLHSTGTTTKIYILELLLCPQMNIIVLFCIVLFIFKYCWFSFAGVTTASKVTWEIWQLFYAQCHWLKITRRQHCSPKLLFVATLWMSSLMFSIRLHQSAKRLPTVRCKALGFKNWGCGTKAPAGCNTWRAAKSRDKQFIPLKFPSVADVQAYSLHMITPISVLLRIK